MIEKGSISYIYLCLCCLDLYLDWTIILSWTVQTDNRSNKGSKFEYQVDNDQSIFIAMKIKVFTR